MSHRIGQHEGGEQGDPLMPLLFSLAIHNALAEVKEQLLDGEFLFAFLDDVYVMAKPDRIRTIYDLLSVKLSTVAGIQLHTGKTCTWNKAGVCPASMAELGLSVWSHEGIKIPGTPVAVQNSFSGCARNALPRMCNCGKQSFGFQIFKPVGKSSSSVPARGATFLRTLPPSESAWCARPTQA